MTAVALAIIFAAVVYVFARLAHDTAELLVYGFSGFQPSPRDEGQPAKGEGL